MTNQSLYISEITFKLATQTYTEVRS